MLVVMASPAGTATRSNGTIPKKVVEIIGADLLLRYRSVVFCERFRETYRFFALPVKIAMPKSRLRASPDN